MTKELPLKKRRLRNKKKKIESADLCEINEQDDEILINGFIPSKYQRNIFDFIKYGSGNAVINALAGASKTTTIVEAVKLIPSSCSALFIAFNKDIVTELEKKLEGIKNVYVRTLHSLGFLMIRRNLGFGIEIDEFKYRTFIKRNIDLLSDGETKKMNKRLKSEYIDNVTSLCDFGRYNLCQTEEDMIKVCSRHDIPVIGEECKTALKVMEWGKENYDSIDFTDMVWLPYELDMSPKGMQYDFIFVDESQDLNVAQRELFLRCFKNGTRFIAVGDPNQCIYSFAGADKDSFKKLQTLPNTTTFPLPISYRCAKKIVSIANTFVNNMEYRDNAPEGEIRYNVKINEIKDGDMVLCRVKMPLVKLYMRYLRMGKKCFIRGKDIGMNLIRMIQATEKKELNLMMDKDGVFVRLYEKLFEDRDRLIEKRGLDIDDALLTSQIMNEYDSIKSIEVISEGLNDAKDLIDRIEKIFSDNSDGICLSTIHKAKGLEAERVFILCKSLMPSKLAKQDWELEQEQNLIYVAYTRAKNVLGFISEKEIEVSNTTADMDKMLVDLKYAENKISKITGKKPAIKMLKSEMSEYRVKNFEPVKTIEDNHVELDKIKK